jgi:hypothetical protein
MPLGCLDRNNFCDQILKNPLRVSSLRFQKEALFLSHHDLEQVVYPGAQDTPDRYARLAHLHAGHFYTHKTSYSSS